LDLYFTSLYFAYPSKNRIAKQMKIEGTIQKQELHQFVGEFMVRIVFAFRANLVVMSFDDAAIYADPIL